MWRKELRRHENGKVLPVVLRELARIGTSRHSLHRCYVAISRYRYIDVIGYLKTLCLQAACQLPFMKSSS